MSQGAASDMALYDTAADHELNKNPEENRDCDSYRGAKYFP